MILYIFFMILYMYMPGAGSDNTLGTKFWCQQNVWSFHLFVPSFKKYFRSLILYIIFFMI